MNRSQWFRAGLLALWLGAGCGQAKEPRGPENGVMPQTIEYWTNAPDDAYAKSLLVSVDGSAELLVGSNRDDPSVSTIGRFGVRGSAAAFAPLFDAVADPEFRSSQTPRTAMPGEVVRRFTIREDSGELTRTVTEQSKPDRAFEKAEAEALRLAATVRRSPRQALAISGVAIDLAPRGPGTSSVSVRVELTNPGQEPVAVPAPRGWAGSGVLFTLTLRRNDVPLDKMGNQHQVFVSFDANDLENGTTLPGSGGERLSLAPASGFSLSLRKEIPSPDPGAYDGWAAFELPLLDMSGAELMRGELVSTHTSVHF